jgi:hypothetical protein
MLRLGATFISSLSYAIDGAGDDDALRFAITACACQAREWMLGGESGCPV